MLAKNIAGEIALSENPGGTIKKWREIFGVRQSELAKRMGVSPSVISDYESGRRKSPGTVFVRKFIETLISCDLRGGGGVIKKFSSGQKAGAILDIGEFLTPVSGIRLIKAVDGAIIANKNLADRKLWGYTVIDSIRAILELSESEFIKLYGLSSERALIFTKVHMGRSPMIAIKVTKPKPNMVVLHGPNPGSVDKLAVKIANTERIPLVVSRLKTEDELVSNLKELMD